MPSPEFSQDYRHNLAVQLFSNPDKQQRRQILTEAQSTLDYQLAKHERKAFQQGIDFSSRPLQEQKQLQQERYELMFDYCLSNESCLYKLFPTIKDKQETILAVGPDQGLDLLVNSQAKYLFMVDIDTDTSQFTRTLLEIGSVHKKIFGHYPNVEQYHEYFKAENIHHIHRLLSDTLGEVNMNVICNKFRHQLTTDNKQPKYYNYLNYKSQLTNDIGQPFSWNSSNENLKRVFEAYDQGRIFVINRDLFSEETLDIIDDIVKSKKSSVQVFYVSNSLAYLQNQKSDHPLPSAISKILTANPTVLVTTKHQETVSYRNKPNVDSSIKSIHMMGWHYLAISSNCFIESIEKLSKFPFNLFSDKNNVSPEPGVTFVGI